MLRKTLWSFRQVAILLCLSAVTGLFAQTGARYLIITHDDLFDAVQPLAQWKQQKGMMCAVVKTSQTGTTNTAIRNYVINACNTWNPRPEFLLLVGAPSLLPAFQRGSGPSRFYTDNQFVNISGDFHAELPCGRFPCKTARQCSVMVAKTLAYERTPYVADTQWFRSGTAVVNDTGDSDAPTYWSDARYVWSLAAAAGYSRFDSLASSLHHNAGSVVQSVNNGTSFVLYRGTATSNWYEPFAVNPLNTTNGTRLPIICSFTCQTVSLDNYDTMIGDAWVKVGTPQSLKGAVAFIGNTHSASHVANVRSAMTHGFFAGVFPETLTTLGAATLRGKQQVWTQMHDSTEYQSFNLLGDPELNAWTTTPHEMDVSHAGEIPVGPDTFLVTVMKSGVPLAGALVCVQDTLNQVYQYAYSNSAGEAQFVFTTSQASILSVTVTRRNCIPYEGAAGIGMSDVKDRPGIVNPSRAARLMLTPNPTCGLVSISGVPNSVIRVFSAAGALVREYRGGTGRVELYTSSLPAGAYVVQGVTGQDVKSVMLRVVK